MAKFVFLLLLALLFLILMESMHSAFFLPNKDDVITSPLYMVEVMKSFVTGTVYLMHAGPTW
jgi:hypothetical protein